jgi:GT2 family glycosyltransferase
MHSYKTRPVIAVVILNWNGYQDTIECLRSLSNVKYGNLQIIVVDNGSDNEDYLKLQTEFPEINLVLSKENLGFTGGNNLGIEFAMKNKPDYFLLLNNDTTVESDFIDYLLEIFNKHKNVGIAAPKINYYHEPKKIWTEGGKISRFRGSGFAYSERYDKGIETEYRNVTFVSGCCMLIKREVLDKIGLFDINYFLYVEDTDLCKRTLDAGFKIYVAYRSKIYHKVSNSTNKDLSGLPLYYVTRNRLYFSKKNYSKTNLIAFFYILITMLIKSIGWIFQGNINNISIVRLAFSDFLKGNMGKVNKGKLKLNRLSVHY